MAISLAPWRLGKEGGSVVCDDETLGPQDPKSREYYGGYVVCESATPSNAQGITALPELLAACKEHGFEDWPHGTFPDALNGLAAELESEKWATWLHRKADEIKAAIAKAEPTEAKPQ